LGHHRARRQVVVDLSVSRLVPGGGIPLGLTDPGTSGSSSVVAEHVGDQMHQEATKLIHCHPVEHHWVGADLPPLVYGDGV
jgi:hypothetical protein